jgi:catechol 2,3-dioxygenase-like lactoylglutathione lyase family enzyme
VILVRDLAKGVQFYQEALGLRVKFQTDSFVEIETGAMPLVLKVRDEELAKFVDPFHGSLLDCCWRMHVHCVWASWRRERL